VIRELIHVNINVTDIYRSLAFYEALGFTVMHVFGDRQDPGDWTPMEMRGRRCRGVVLSLSDHPRAATKIELLEWIDPKTEPAPPREVTQAGVARVALRTRDLASFTEKLRSTGIEFESAPVEIDVVGASRFVLFRDPEGTLLELIEF